MNNAYNKKLVGNAKTLRKAMTKEERNLWYDFLKPLPVMVHRQKVIGNYIVDFYIAQAKIVVELDGSQHYEVEGKQADKKEMPIWHLWELPCCGTPMRISINDSNRCVKIFGIGCRFLRKSLLLEEKVPPKGADVVVCEAEV